MPEAELRRGLVLKINRHERRIIVRAAKRARLPLATFIREAALRAAVDD